MTLRLLIFTCTWFVLAEFLCCSEEDAALPRAERFHSCLYNCANCVQFWEYGLYNGRRCAKRCVHLQGREVVDPDCNDPNMFNYSPQIIQQLLQMQQRKNGLTPTTNATRISGDISIDALTQMAADQPAPLDNHVDEGGHHQHHQHFRGPVSSPAIRREKVHGIRHLKHLRRTSSSVE